MPEADPFVTLKGVSIRLGDRVLFKNIQWEILTNQHWLVVGKNGSGKSTLIRALCGSIPVLDGKVIYHFDRMDSAQRQIAHVTFESQRSVLGDDSFYQARWNAGVDQDAASVSQFLSKPRFESEHLLSVADNGADPNPCDHWQQIVEQLELSELLPRRVTELSNGERRKVTIARALLGKPRLLILDNPFTGLDDRFRSKLSENLEALMNGDMRIVIIETKRDLVPNGINHILSVNDNGTISPTSFRRGTRAKGRQTKSIADWHTPHNHSEDSPSGKILLQMKNVSVNYGALAVLRKVSWTVREGERWALLGPNGAGKTTLLSLILADNPQAYANDITLFGRQRGSGESIWEIKQNIGWVSPELQLYYPGTFTCLDVVCSGWFDSVGIYRKSTMHQQSLATEWLNKFGLRELAQKPFALLSEGEQRLALLARALVKNPALLILDEPCQGLDAANSARVLQAVASVSGRSKSSMIYVTHRVEELPSTITHTLRLHNGQIQ